MRHSGIVLVLAAASVAGSTGWAKSPKKTEVSQILCPARFVYVATMDGDVMRPDVLPEDHDAVSRVEDKLRNWKRYIEVYKPQESDIVLIVRTGRLATAKGSVGVRGGRTGPILANRAPRDPADASQGPDNNPSYGGMGNGTSVGAGGELGPPNDLLAVYTKPGDINRQTPMWEKTEKNGLDGPKVPLFVQFRAAIDKTCQEQSDNGKP